MIHEIFGPVLTVEFPALTATNCSNSNLVIAIHLRHRTFMHAAHFMHSLLTFGRCTCTLTLAKRTRWSWLHLQVPMPSQVGSFHCPICSQSS
jgi:hypothetical protein